MERVIQASVDASLLLSACYSLVYLDNELIGDPLELAVLEAVRWKYGSSSTCVSKHGDSLSVS